LKYTPIILKNTDYEKLQPNLLRAGRKSRGVLSEKSGRGKEGRGLRRRPEGIP